MPTMKTEPLTPKQAAAALNLHPVTVRKWIASGRLPVTRDGRAVWIDPAHLEPFRALSDPRRTCLHCVREFTPIRKKAVYCSDACRGAATAARRKAAHPAERGPGRPPANPPRPVNPAKVPERLKAAFAAVQREAHK